MADEYPVLQELETKLKLQWVDTDDYMATQRAIIEVTPDHAYLELPRGRKGDKGDPGPAISIQGIVAAYSQLPANAEIGHAYVNTSTKGLAVWNGSQWFKVDNFAGVDADVQQFSRWFAQIESDMRRAEDAAERAEIAAEETIQQVTGDFATRNYVDTAAENMRWDKSIITNADTARTVGAHRTNSDTTNLPANAASTFGSLEVLPSGNASISQRFTTWGSVIETWERNPISGDAENWSEWQLKPSIAAVADKADKSYVESALDGKADTATVDTIDVAVKSVQKAVEPIAPDRDDSFAILDVNNRSALSVNPDGSTTIGSTLIEDASTGFRVLDSDNRVAFEITSGGKTIVHDLVGAEGGGGSTTVTELHAFICAGQSNMSGRGDPVDDVLDVENPRLLQFGHYRRVIEPAPALLDMMDSPLGLSPARQFGLRYLQTQPANVAVLLIPAAHGGTGFTYEPTPGRKTWTKGHADTEENGLYERALAQSQDALTAAQQAGYAVELKGLLWHQGEANGSSLPQNMQAYSERLDALIDDFRTDLNAPDLPAVVGEMMPEGMRDSIAKRSIGYMHAATPGRVQRTAFAPAPDNTMRHNDFAHFSREGAILLGDSFFDAWPRAVLNVPTGKPRAARNVTACRVGDEVTVSWSAPMSRVTSYVVEWASAPDGIWQEVTREWPMNLSETFTAHDAPVWVRVTAYEDTTPATPTNPIPALGA